jgi:amino acid adenylation domain-containing protein
MQSLLQKLKENNIAIALDESDLKVRFNGTNLPIELIRELKEKKGELIEYLTNLYKEEEGIQVIPPNPNGYYPVTSAQRRLWVLSQFEEGGIAYNMRGGYVLEGELDKQAISFAFDKLIERHEILRTVFKENEDGDIVQVILPAEKSAAAVRYNDLRENEQQQAVLKKLVQDELTTPFDLAKGPLIRASLSQLTDKKWVFTYVMHHIISDGWSMGILINELMLIYNAAVKGEKEVLTPLRIQYKDYASWLQKQLNELSAVHQNYWLDQFSGEIPILELPGDKLRPLVRTYNGGVVYKVLDEHLTARLKEYLNQESATLFMGLLAAVNALLYRYTAQEDIIIGSPVAGRDHEDLEAQIGFYLNTLALRTRFRGNEGYAALVKNVKQVTLNAYEHQVYPFEELVDALQLERNMSRNALFDVLIILQNTDVLQQNQQQKLGGIEISTFEGGDHVISKADLTFDFMETRAGLQLTIEYNSDIYHRESIARLSDHFEQLLEKMLFSPQAPISELIFLNPSEKQKLIEDSEGLPVAYTTEQTFVDFFEKQVSAHPDQVALYYEKNEYSYAELNQLANSLSDYLRLQVDIKADDRIGILLPRTEWMLIAMLAVLKSGAAYVPVDPDYPAERIAYIREDSQCKVMIDTDYVASFLDKAEEFNAQNPSYRPLPQNLAYVTYTSGSTGKPKGVMVEHQNLNAFFANFDAVFGIKPGMVLAAGTSITFDISVLELLGSLAKGLSIRLMNEIDNLEILVQNSPVTNVLQITPSKLNQLIELDPQASGHLNRLDVLLIGGEAWTNRDYDRLKVISGPKIINVYGPTETTIWSSSLEIHQSESLSIGFPLSNERIYILDPQGAIVPYGVAGEICIAGTGVARGYINKPELTQTKFVKDPFVLDARMYKTGDLGRRRGDGSIEFIGRIDDQVKIRGYRIEPEEIRMAIQQYPDINSVVIMDQANAYGEKELIAFLVSKTTIDIADLRGHLRKMLPEYMLPGYFVQLDRLPLTLNGKIDRKKLAESLNGSLKREVTYVAPGNYTEEKLVEIWQNILGRPQIGVNDNFFDLGGHSLKATRLSSQLYKHFDVKITLKELFIHTILKEQAELIKKSPKISFAAIPIAASQPYYPISAFQRRLWVMSQFEEGNGAYNIPSINFLEGQLDFSALTYAFDTLLARHETLRTVFKEVDQGIVGQFILAPDDIGFHINQIDLSAKPSQESLLQEQVGKDFTLPFDFEKGPLLRVGLYQLNTQKWVITLVMHHIISDAWSMKVLTDELFVLYNAYTHKKDNPLPPLRIQYKDYTLWQQNRLTAEYIDNERSYWLNQFSGNLPVLELPGFQSRPMVKTYNCGTLNKVIPPVLSQRLKKLAEDNDVTLFMALLGAVNVLLYRYTGQEDITIGSPIAGREHIDLEDQIGFYVNTLALRTKFSGVNNFKEILEAVKEVTLGAYEHQLYPFDELVNELKLSRDASRNPLFDIQVILQNIDLNLQTGTEPAALEVHPYDKMENQRSVFDIVFNFTVVEESLEMSMVYNSDIYNQAYIIQLSTHLEQLLEVLMDEPLKPVKQLDYLNESDKQQLISFFNDQPVPYDQQKTLVDLFRAQVAKTPEATAVVAQDNCLTYAELDQKSEQLAAYLLEKYQLKADDMVGIMLNRSEALLIGILGILKSGAAYVPIDAAYPKTRKEFIVKDTRVKLLISQTDYIFDLDYYGGDVFAIDVQLNGIEISDEYVPVVPQPANLAYVIYTSGSTGTPKGILIDHAAVANSIQAQQCIFNLKPDDRSLQFFSPSFDVSVFEIFIALLQGATLYLTPDEIREDTMLLEQYMNDHEITVATLPAAYLPLLKADKLTSLKKLISGGEQPTQDHVAKITAHMDYFNAYGPTESSICATVYHMAKGTKKAMNKIPIGKPIPGVALYVLDAGLSLLPLGQIGELYIGGDGLAKGYLNNPELTEDKFIADPFHPGKRLYRTGDLGRWLLNGEIEFCGREDDQLKLRGYRIEAGEIQKALLGYVGITAAAVLLKPNRNEEQELVAYLVGEEILKTYEIKNYLSTLLPAYMVPAYLVQIEQIPLTGNGKVDAAQLPSLEDLALENTEMYVEASNETESALVKIWQQVLERNQIGIRDNFFDLGGNSLKAIRILSRIREDFKVNFKIDELFNNLTIELIGREIIRKKWAADQTDSVTDEKSVVL